MASELVPSAATYIVDDQDPAIQYLCPIQQQHATADGYFDKTWTTIEDNDCGNGWFMYSFNGTGIRVVAPTTQGSPMTYHVQFDGDTDPIVFNFTTGTTPVLSRQDGSHTMIYSIGATTLYPSFDYLTVTAGASTSLMNKRIIVDDDDESSGAGSLVFSGNWTMQPAPEAVIEDYSSMPYMNTTHWSATPGDSFTFQFTGSTVSIYGILPNLTTTSNDTIMITLDDEPINIPLHTLSNETSRFNLAHFPMTRLFQSSDLTATAHNLTLNITSISPSNALGIDFVTYNASFDKLAGSQQVNPLAVGSASEEKHDIKTIVGAVIGSVVGVLLLLLLGCFFMRKTGRSRAHRKTISLSQKLKIGGAATAAQRPSGLEGGVIYRIDSFTSTDDAYAYGEKKRSSHDSFDLPVLHRDQKAVPLA